MRILILLLGLGLSSYIFAKDITISLTHFPPYVDKNRKDFGLYPKYLTNFFKKINYNVTYEFAPFARTVKNLELGQKTDFTIVGMRAYPQILKNKIIYRSEVFDEVKYCIFYKKTLYPKGLHGKKIEDLNRPPMVSIIGSPLNKTLRKHKSNLFKATTFEGAFKMLMRERGKIFVNSEVIGKHYLKQMGISDKIDCAHYPLSEKVILITPIKSHKEKILPKFNKYLINVPLSVD